MVEFASMGNLQEVMTRRRFIVYHVSPFLTAAGVLITVVGGNELLTANRTRDDFRNYLETNTQVHIEDTQCGPTASVEERADCVEQILKGYDSSLSINSERMWSEAGGSQAEKKARIGTVVVIFAVGIKLFDSLLQRRSLQNQTR